MNLSFTTPSIRRPALPNQWDVLAFVIVIAVGILIVHAHKGMVVPFEIGATELPISLDPRNLPEYALRTALRMGIAMAGALGFSLVYAAIAAKSRKAEKLLIPLLDILQSIPILGFEAIAITPFIALFPGNLLGVECASIFAIFTSQAWNITFSLYQSFRTVPLDLEEATRMYHASPWRKFWRLEVPFAMPQLVWNIMMSSSGGWFFVVASEAMSVSGHQVNLPGIGSYIFTAIAAKNLPAVFYALLAMLVIILIIDQMVMRPLLVWSDKFRPSDDPTETTRGSWFLTMLQHGDFLNWFSEAVDHVVEFAGQFGRRQSPSVQRFREPFPPWLDSSIDFGWSGFLILLGLYCVWQLYIFVSTDIGVPEILHVLLLSFYTAARVFFWIVIASLVWVPIGVMIGLRPKLAQAVQPVVQILAAFPANLLFPIAVILITRFQANPEIWLSPLMILGTQWYILFNVIGGISTMPVELQFAAQNFGAKGFFWWRRVALPYVLPAYVTGAVTASGGSWNASIVSEIVKWGDTTLNATGVGAYIATATDAGDMPRVMLGIGALCIYVTTLNRLLWRRLYSWAEERVRLG